MYCVKCGTEIKGHFCSKCGTKVEEQTQNGQQQMNSSEKINNEKTNANQGRNPNILVRSESCIQLVEETKKANEKGANSFLTTAGVIVIFALFTPYLLAALDDKKMSQVEGIPLPIVFLLLVMLIFAWVAVSKQTKETRELYNKYRGYCSTEVLVVDEYKIYGSTTKGEIELNYDQIESVRFLSNVWSPSDRKPIITNDIFKVKDVIGNEFVFYSFSNCKELKTIIDMQMRNAQNDRA